MHRIYWFEGGLQFAEIAAKNVVQNDLNTMVKGQTTDREHLYKRGDRRLKIMWNNVFYMTRLDLVRTGLTQFEMVVSSLMNEKNIENLLLQKKKMLR